MEIMTKEEYLKNRLGKLLLKLEEIENAFNEARCSSIEEAAFQTNWDITHWLELENDEESPHFMNFELDEAYDAYVEANKEEPEHIYEVSFSVPSICGKVNVRAKDEDEAEEYVQSNLDVRFETDPCYMADDEKVCDDIEMDYDMYGYGNCSIDDVEDLGEYEED